MSLTFKLNTTLSRSATANSNDVLRTKQALFGLGYYEPLKTEGQSVGITPYPDTGLFSAIEAFQADHGLRKDGTMKPDGETATALAQSLSASAACPAGQHPETKKHCIPFTNICWMQDICIPNDGGGVRG